MSETEIQELKTLLEISIQQKSASDSDTKKHIFVLDEVLKEQNKTLERIEAHVTKTNGNVKNLQLWEASSKGWVKGFGVSVVCIIALIGIIYSSMNTTERKTQELITKHIDETTSVVPK